MAVYKISLSDAQADKLADYLSQTAGEVDARVADEIRSQIPRPVVAEPTAFGSIVRADCGPGLRGIFWQKAPMQRKHYWESETGAVEIWSDLQDVEVVRVGISSTPHTDAYLEGRQDIADAIRQDIAALRAEAITAERKDAYDEALAAVTARLGDS